MNGSATTRHFYANGLHIAENRSGTLEYYHQDHLGSTRLKTDGNGDSIYDTNYIPFGSTYGESGSEEFKYTGKREDSTGLYYYGARYYDPQVGRFITEDPITGSLYDPHSLNRYVYCRNNPHKYTDPDGRLWNVAIGAGVGALVNCAFYTISHWEKRGTRDFNKGLFKSIVTGAVEGGIMGATAGVINPTMSLAKKGAIKIGGNVIGKSVGALTELSMDIAAGDFTRRGFIRQFAHTTTDVVIGTGVDTGLELILPKGSSKVARLSGEIISETASSIVVYSVEWISDRTSPSNYVKYDERLDVHYQVGNMEVDYSRDWVENRRF